MMQKHLIKLHFKENITDYINKIGLSHPNIRFLLVNDDKELLKTDGSGNLLKCISSNKAPDSRFKTIHNITRSPDIRLIYTGKSLYIPYSAMISEP